MMWKAKVRALVACFGLAACFTVFSYRLIYLQVYKQSEYSALAADKHLKKREIYARRGFISDVHQEVLANNEPVRTVVADGSLITDLDATLTVLQPLLRLEEKDLAERRVRLEKEDRYVVLKRRVPEELAMELMGSLREKNMRGVMFEQDFVRNYPNGRMLCHVLGFMNHDQDGIQGIERSLNSYLRGQDGFRWFEHDRTGREIVPYRGQERPPRHGCHVRLTVDMGLQHIVENELDQVMKDLRPHSAVVILMRPQTGEILAMANRPSFSVGEIGKVSPEAMKNRAIIEMVEPGSTFKIVPTAAALTEKLVRPDTVIFCENGRFQYGGKPLRDHHPYGALSVEEILVKSSNIGSAKLAMQLGDLRFYEYVRKFGFGERTGINLPGEIGGMLQPPHRWDKLTITRLPMGHAIGATPIQLVSAMSVIANGGKLMMPQIVAEITDESGASIAKFPPVEVRQVVSAEAADQVRTALVKVVTGGTAKTAAVEGYSVGGKTGTAQRVDADPRRGYTPGKYVVSFLGFMPAEDPEFVALVMIDDANVSSGENYGGVIAAPVFARIAEKAARYLNLEPQPELSAQPIILTQTHR